MVGLKRVCSPQVLASHRAYLLTTRIPSKVRLVSWYVCVYVCVRVDVCENVFVPLSVLSHILILVLIFLLHLHLVI